MSQDGTSRKRKRTEYTNEDLDYEPPRKLKRLDEEQVYIGSSEESSDTTDSSTVINTQDSWSSSSQGDLSQPDQEDERRAKLRDQWSKILPTLKRSHSCDIDEGSCKYHKFNDEDDPDYQPPQIKV